MNTLWQDVLYGARILCRSPGFTAVAVATLALGIGANTAIFSVVNAALLRPLAFEEPERLVMVWESLPKRGIARNNPAPANYAGWRAQNEVFEDMAAIRNQFLNLTGAGEPVQFEAHFVTANLFSVLGVEPALGRFFFPEEDRPGAPRVAVLSHRVWQQSFGGDRPVVGRSVLLDDEKYTIVGVLPRAFSFRDRSETRGHNS